MGHRESLGIRLCPWPFFIFDICLCLWSVCECDKWYPSQLQVGHSKFLEMYYLFQWHTDHLNCLLGFISPYQSFRQRGTLTWFLFLRLRHYSRFVVGKAGEALLLIWSAFSSRAHTLWVSNTAQCLTMKCGLLRPYKDLAHTVLLCDSTLSLSSINFCVLWLMEVVVIFFPLTCTGTR